MSDRSNLASGCGVFVAVLGSAVHDIALSVLGPAIALAVHMWSEYRATKLKREESALVEQLKARNWQLEVELGKLRGPGPPPSQSTP